MGMDLGVCDSFLSDGSRCQGRLIVDGELGGLVEATCSECGSCAGCPRRRLELDREEAAANG